MTSSIWLVDNPNRTITLGDPLLGLRRETWRWELLDLDGAPIGDLGSIRPDGTTTGGVRDGSLELIGETASGKIHYSGTAEPDWLSVLVRPVYRADFPDGTFIEEPQGIYLPIAPDTDHDHTRVDVDVELQSLLTILREDEVDKTYSLPVGTVVTTAVRALITGASTIAGARVAGTDSAETLRTGKAWDPGTPRLDIINALLAAINYRPLRVDRTGTYRLDPQVPPDGRAVAWEFAGESAIYRPAFKRTRDWMKAPNRFTAVASGDGGTFAITATEVNDNPGSPLSTVRRRRTISVTESHDATSMTVLRDIAKRRLAELSQVTSTLEFDHPWLPIEPADVVSFGNDPAGLEVRAVVESMSITCRPGASVRTKIREVPA